MILFFYCFLTIIHSINLLQNQIGKINLYFARFYCIFDTEF